MKRIPVGDFPLGQEEQEALERVIRSGRISMGAEVRAFEEEFAAWLGIKHCVAVSSGTAALMCGLKAMGYAGLLTPGARVLVPALTFIATVNAVKLCGMEPVFGDVGPHNYCLNSYAVIDADWRDLIMPVHLFGYAANMDAFVGHGEIVVEDAAEAHGTMYRGHKVGTLGLWSAFSFYIAHSIQAGELGCVCTDDDDLATICRSIRAFGRSCTCKRCTRREGKCPHLEEGDPRFTFQYIGYNFKPMEFQAALARVQLRNVESNIEKRRANFALLKELLEPLKGYINPIALQPEMVPMVFPIVLQHEGIRDRVIAELEQQGVEARPLFGCIPTQQPAYSEYRELYEGKLPVAEYVGANGFYVGCHQYLGEGDVQRLGETIVRVVKGM
jgi:dTDP-4-amino-4,6-dideoxygalactose transaminase